MTCSEIDGIEGDFTPYGLLSISLQDQKTLWNGRAIQVVQDAHTLLKLDTILTNIFQQSTDPHFFERLFQNLTFDDLEDLDEEEERDWQFALVQPLFPSHGSENLTLEQFLEQTGMLFDPQLGRYIDCKSWLKKVAHSAEKKLRKAGKKTVKFVKEHKKEILIGTAVVVGGAALVYIGAVVAEAVIATEAAKVIGGSIAATAAAKAADEIKDRNDYNHAEENAHSHASATPEKNIPQIVSSSSYAFTTPSSTQDVMKQLFGSLYQVPLTPSPHQGIYTPEAENRHIHTASPPPFTPVSSPDNKVQQFFNNPFYANLNPISYKPEKPQSTASATSHPVENIVPAPSRSNPFKSNFGTYLDNLHRSQLDPDYPSSTYLMSSNYNLQEIKTSGVSACNLSASFKNAITRFIGTLDEELKEIGQSPRHSELSIPHFSSSHNFQETPRVLALPPERSQPPLHNASLEVLDLLASKFEAIANEYKPIVNFQNTSHFYEKMAHTLRNSMETMNRTGCGSSTVQSNAELHFLNSSVSLTSQPERNFLKNAAEILGRGLETIGRGMYDSGFLEFNSPLHEFNDQAIQKWINLPVKNAFAAFFESIAIGKESEICLGAGIPPEFRFDVPEIEKCQIYKTEGPDIEGMCITYSNGINNTLAFAKSNAEHIRNLSPNKMCIHGVYNHTNGPGIDALEVLFCNFAGVSPGTQDLLGSKWKDFHEKNLHRPHAKILHFCHSKGALDTVNVLLSLPKKIQDRIIVVAIAPAQIVPRAICYESFNYTSEKDIVHLADVLLGSLYAAGLGEEMQQKRLLEIWENRKQLIFLEAHDNASFFDHELQSDTFKSTIEALLADYVTKKGEYQ